MELLTAVCSTWLVIFTLSRRKSKTWPHSQLVLTSLIPLVIKLSYTREMHSPVFKAFQSKLQVCVWPSSIKAKGQVSSFLKFCSVYGFTYINLIYAYLGEI